MNTVDYALVIVLLAVLFFALRTVVRQRKKGGCSCGCGCTQCSNCSKCK